MEPDPNSVNDSPPVPDDRHGNLAIADWVRRHAPLIRAGGNVLDLACGKGRHSRFFLDLGMVVTAVDRDVRGVRDLITNPAAEIIEADLEGEEVPGELGGGWPLGERHFDGVVVVNYLHRPLFPNILAAIAPGGVLIYQTFATGHEKLGRPRNPDFLLRENELKDSFTPDLEVIDFQQGKITRPAPAIVQQICCRRP